MIRDITLMTKKRGLRNVVNADRQPIIPSYATAFSEYYETQLQDAKEQLNALMSRTFDNSFTLENPLEEKFMTQLHKKRKA